MYQNKISAIYSNGRIGQIIVLGRVIFSKEDKMYGFEQPHLFRIISKEGENWSIVYELESLSNGKKIEIDHKYVSCLYDASEWVKQINIEKEMQKNAASEKIEELRDKIKMLTDILIRQGNKVIVVTKDQEAMLKNMGIIT